MEPPRVVALDDEDRLLAAFLRLAEGLRGLFRIPLAAVLLELFARHGPKLPVAGLRTTFVHRNPPQHPLRCVFVRANSLFSPFPAWFPTVGHNLGSCEFLRPFHFHAP